MSQDFNARISVKTDIKKWGGYATAKNFIGGILCLAALCVWLVFTVDAVEQTVGTTLENPQAGFNGKSKIKGETYEKENMYSSFITKAEADKNSGLVQTFKGAMAAEVQVTIASAVTLCERPGITGAGWAVAYDVADGAKTTKRIANIYPNHPDDWGKTTGTGFSYSSDDGRTWVAGADNLPISGMLDMWQDVLHNGDLITFGIRSVPDPDKALANPAVVTDGNPYVVGISKDHGKTWQMETATIHCPNDIGVIARPLPRIFDGADGTMFMPAYSWSEKGNRALLLKSGDRGRNWNVASTIAAEQATLACGAPLTAPWFETMVARTSDGSLLAVMRTGSSTRSALVTTRSTDGGITWSPVEKVLAGPQKRIVAGKLPNLCLLPNGVLVLLTAHMKNHCRIYLSLDGTGREWTDGFIVTSQSGGNTSMVGIGPDKLLVFTTAKGRINSWLVTIFKNVPIVKSSLPADIQQRYPAQK